MNTKLRIEKMAEAINYFDLQNYFFKGDGSELTVDELLEKGMTEDDFPLSIKEFKKLGFGFSKAEYFCVEDDREVLYTLNNKNKSIIIDSERFSLKEYLVIVDMIRRHLDSIGPGQFISFGTSDEDTHVLYHEEGTAFGVWWEKFFNVYTKWLDDENKPSQIHIFTDDYQTNDERYHTKDRVIHICLF